MDDPHQTLAQLDDDSDTECLYIDRSTPHDAYIWATPDAEATEETVDGEEITGLCESYTLLSRTRSGSWNPMAERIRLCDAAHWLEDAIENDVEVEVRPQTKLPPGRHPADQK